MGVVSAIDDELVPFFTGLTVGPFRKLVRVVRRRGGHVLDRRPSHSAAGPGSAAGPAAGGRGGDRGRHRNDCTAFAASGIDRACGNAFVLADGAYRGTGCLIPHRRQPGQAEVTGWRADHNRSHRKVRARVEHVPSRMKNSKVLRDCRRKGDGVFWQPARIAHMHNLAMSG